MNKAKTKALELAIQYVNEMPEKMLDRVFLKVWDIKPQKAFTFTPKQIFDLAPNTGIHKLMLQQSCTIV